MERVLSPKEAAVLVAYVFPVTFGFGQHTQVQPDAAELQKLQEQIAKPGKEHQQLPRLVGTWKA